MPDGNKTFAVAPLKVRPGTPPRSRTLLINVEGRVSHGHPDDITRDERLSFWLSLSDWVMLNVLALEHAEAEGAGSAAG